MDRLDLTIKQFEKVGLIKATGDGFELVHDILAEKISARITDLEREKLVAESKIKSRYIEYANSNFNNKFYLDRGDLSLIKGNLELLDIEEKEEAYVKNSKRRLLYKGIFQYALFALILILAVVGTLFSIVLEGKKDELGNKNAELEAIIKDLNKTTTEKVSLQIVKDQLERNQKELEETIIRKDSLQKKIDSQNQELLKKSLAFEYHTNGERFVSIYANAEHDFYTKKLREIFRKSINLDQDNENNLELKKIVKRDSIQITHGQVGVDDVLSKLSKVQSANKSSQVNNKDKRKDETEYIRNLESDLYFDSAQVQFTAALFNHPELTLSSKELIVLNSVIGNYDFAKELFFDMLQKDYKHFYFYHDILDEMRFSPEYVDQESALKYCLELFNKIGSLSNLNDENLFRLGCDFWWKVCFNEEVSEVWKNKFFTEVISVFRRIHSPKNYQIENIIEILAISEEDKYYTEFLNKVSNDDKQSSLIIYLIAIDLPNLENKKMYLDLAYVLDSTNSFVLSKYVDYYLSINKCDSATFYEQKLDSDNLRFETYHDLGIAFGEGYCEDKNLSLNYFRKASAINPEDTDLHEHLADAFYGLIEYDSALYYYNRVLEVNNENEEALHRKGIILNKKGEYTESVDVFYDLVLVNSKRHYVLDHLIEGLLLVQDTSSVWQLLDIFIDPELSDENEDRALYLNAYASSLSHYGIRLDDALKYSLESINITADPGVYDQVKLWNTLAEVYFLRGDLIKADQSNKKAKRLAIQSNNIELLEKIEKREKKIASSPTY